MNQFNYITSKKNVSLNSDDDRVARHHSGTSSPQLIESEEFFLLRFRPRTVPLSLSTTTLSITVESQMLTLNLRWAFHQHEESLPSHHHPSIPTPYGPEELSYRHVRSVRPIYDVIFSLLN